jgi:predicted esterase YcpF (UPF0227 family)
MKIIYLHGFGSSGDSEKSRALKAAYGEQSVISPDLPMDPDSVIAMIATIVNANVDYPLIFVGTSLGGFYANFFAQRHDAPCVLVNPSTKPSVTMRARLGQNINYTTGATFQVTAHDLALFAAMEYATEEAQNGALISLFLAEDDDVLDPTVALKAFPYTKTKIITKDGGHRYEKHWATVVDYIKTLV